MNDRVVGFVIAVAAIFYGLVLLTEYIPKAYRWFKHRKAMAKVDAGEIPVDYAAVGKEQRRLNQVDESGPMSKRLGVAHEARLSTIESIRELVAEVRYAGYLRGEEDQWHKVAFAAGVRSNPHVTGSGAAQQWVRGYCMGRNVLDPKPYMDVA